MRRRPLVPVEVRAAGEGDAAVGAAVRPLAGVDANLLLVLLFIVQLLKVIAALALHHRLQWLMLLLITVTVTTTTKILVIIVLIKPQITGQIIPLQIDVQSVQNLKTVIIIITTFFTTTIFSSSLNFVESVLLEKSGGIIHHHFLLFLRSIFSLLHFFHLFFLHHFGHFLQVLRPYRLIAVRLDVIGEVALRGEGPVAELTLKGRRLSLAIH
ncbi:hypothetical protein TYRP_015444 [Tyrophagus putrescentiae]|nr:hypothetical protein TYRP_015444 [Tyrophagus putrescentiae]